MEKELVKVGGVYRYTLTATKSGKVVVDCIVEVTELLRDSRACRFKVLKVLIDDSGNKYYTYLYESKREENGSYKYLEEVTTMNKSKRKRIGEIMAGAEQIRDGLSRGKSPESVCAEVSDLCEQLEEIKYEEEDVRDNYPENLHSSEIYDAMCCAVDSIESAMSALESAKDALEENDSETAIVSLDEALDSLEEI